MNYSEMMQIASNYVSQRTKNNMPVRYTDTVCVLRTCQNNIFTGFSGMELNNHGIPITKHAEKDVINNMLMYNDLVIDCFSVFNASTMSFVVPCSSCINSLLRLHPANANSAILTPSKVIWLGQAEQFFNAEQMKNAGMYNNQPHNNYYQNMQQTNVSHSGSQKSVSSALYSADDKEYDGTFLKNKLNMLFDDDADDDIEENDEKKEKKRFKFFGR